MLPLLTFLVIAILDMVIASPINNTCHFCNETQPDHSAEIKKDIRTAVKFALWGAVALAIALAASVVGLWLYWGGKIVVGAASRENGSMKLTKLGPKAQVGIHGLPAPDSEPAQPRQSTDILSMHEALATTPPPGANAPKVPIIASLFRSTTAKIMYHG